MCICRRIARAPQAAASRFFSNGFTDVNQLLLRSRVILKDGAPASRLIVTAAKPEQRVTDLTSVNEPHSDLVSHICGGNNHSEIVEVDKDGQSGSRRGDSGVLLLL